MALASLHAGRGWNRDRGQRVAAQRLVDARYEYNWNAPIGSLSGALKAIGRTADASAISVLTGVAFAPPPFGESFAPRPDPLELPPLLGAGLRALGVKADAVRRERPPDGWSWRLLRLRMRRDLAAGRPIVAARAGVDPFGPAFGLIVGYDDERGAWRRDGPMTEQVGPWLPYDELRAATPLAIVRLRPTPMPDADALRQAARRAEAVGRPATRAAIGRWIGALEGDATIDPQGHARAAQAIAAARGEAAEFWRACGPDSAEHAEAQAIAVALSRFATLFPYPMGGAPNARGARTAGVAILREVLERIAD